MTNLVERFGEKGYSKDDAKKAAIVTAVVVRNAKDNDNDDDENIVVCTERIMKEHNYSKEKAKEACERLNKKRK